MSAALTDKLRKGAPFAATVLSSSISDTDTSITVDSTTGWPTDTAIDIVIDRVDSDGNQQDTSLREVLSVTVSGTTLTTDATRRGLDGTTVQSHAAGAVVEVNFTADQWNDHIDGFLVSHNQDGTHKADTVDTQAIEDEAVTTGKIADEAVTPEKTSFMTKTVDANGWTVLDYGSWKEYYLAVSISGRTNWDFYHYLPSGLSNVLPSTHMVTVDAHYTAVASGNSETAWSVDYASGATNDKKLHVTKIHPDNTATGAAVYQLKITATR